MIACRVASVTTGELPSAFEMVAMEKPVISDSVLIVGRWVVERKGHLMQGLEGVSFGRE